MGRAGWWRIELGLWSAGAAVLALWAMRWLGQSLPAGLAVALGAVAVMLALGRRPTPHGAELIWNGQGWALAIDGRTERIEVRHVRVMIDAGRWLLLQLIGPAVPPPHRWQCVVEAKGRDVEFRDLCTALYAQRSSTSLPVPPEPR